MKDISRIQPARRKRKHSTESWTAKYKQLEIFILKDFTKKEETPSPIKKETAATKPSKKRKAATDIAFLGKNFSFVILTLVKVNKIPAFGKLGSAWN